MDELQIKHLAELDDSFLDQTVELFVESFYKPLSNLSTDKTKHFRVFRNAFVKDHFYVGLLDDKVVGMIAYSTQKGSSQILDRKVLQREFGIIKGLMGYAFLGEKPIPIEANQAYIEDVATADAARGKGVATRLITHLVEALPYEEFTLEVIDTNVNAVRLYEKLGFVVFLRKKQRFFKKQAGFNEKLYMIKKKIGK